MIDVYFADTFAGKGGVARAIRRCGFQARVWEKSRGEHGDLTRPRVLRRLTSDIRAGKCRGVMLAPPCSSFSIAKARSAPIRSVDRPWGFSRGEMSDQDWEKLQVGNKCLRAVLKIIAACNSAGVPWILENPHSSYMFKTPELAKLADRRYVSTIVSDFCQFGTRWRKRTRFLSGHLHPDELARLSKTCDGRNGICSRTGRPHLQLEGASPEGVRWTAIAQTYPQAINRALAKTLVSQAMCVFFQV